MSSHTTTSQHEESRSLYRTPRKDFSNNIPGEPTRAGELTISDIERELNFHDERADNNRRFIDQHEAALARAKEVVRTAKSVLKTLRPNDNVNRDKLESKIADAEKNIARHKQRIEGCAKLVEFHTKEKAAFFALYKDRYEQLKKDRKARRELQDALNG